MSARRGRRILRDVEDEEGTADIDGVGLDGEGIDADVFVGAGIGADADVEVAVAARDALPLTPETAAFLGIRGEVGIRDSFSSFFVRVLGSFLTAEVGGGVSTSIGTGCWEVDATGAVSSAESLRSRAITFMKRGFRQRHNREEHYSEQVLHILHHALRPEQVAYALVQQAHWQTPDLLPEPEPLTDA